MEEKDRQTLDLEEIMKEFHEEPDEQQEEVELPEDFREFLELNVTEKQQPAEALGDTQPISVQEIREAVQEQVTGDTIRLDAIRIDPKDISGPKEENQLQEEHPDTQAEAFTTTWEPEYEQPMGEYIPPQPIIFQPRSRLRELKRKLVAGPERRYYALSEKGVGKLQMAMFLSVLTALICIGATVMDAMGMVQPERLRLMVFGQFLGLLVSALLGSFQMIEGLADLFKGRFSPNTLLVVTFVVCCADGVFCLQQQRIPCCGAFSLQVTMSLWGAYHRRVTEMGQMDTMRKATHLDGIAAVPDFYQGRKGLVRTEGQVEHFMDHYDRPTKQEKTLFWYCLAAMLVSAGIGITAGLYYGLHMGMQAAAVSLLAAMPATMFITLTRPYAILERRLHRLGTVLCGWQGVEALSGKAVVPLTHQELYPAGTVRMNGVKFFGSRNTDDIVAYCAAMVAACDSGLEPIFTQVLDSRNGIHYTPENVICYDGGVSGTIDEETVLVGSISFMNQMGVEVPESGKVSNAVYVAIEGEFCGLFALTYEKTKGSTAGMSTLCAYRRLNPVITGGDFVLSQSFIRYKFGVNTKHILFPEPEVRQELQQIAAPEDAVSALMVTTQGLAPFAYGITGARALRRAGRLGVIVHMAGGILGMGMMLVLVLLGAMHMLTPVNVLAYQLVWMIPGFLLTEWTRTI